MVDVPESRVSPESIAKEALRPLSEAGVTDQIAWGLVDAAPDGIVVTDEAGQILLVNRQTEELFGYDRGDLLGRSVDDLLHDEFRAVHRAHRAGFAAEPSTRPIGIGLMVLGRRRDGSEFPLEISLSPLATDAGLMVVAVVRDVSERVDAEAEVRRVRESLDATHDGVFIFDAETLRFTYVNQGAVDQVGYPRDELLDMTMPDIAPEFTEARLREVLNQLASGEASSSTFTTLHRRRDGTDVPVEIVLQPASVEPGRPRSFVKITRDIGERLAREEELSEAERNVRVFEERSRIARDLHDVVIQRLFAAGLAVQGIWSQTDEPEKARRLADVVDELDETIREMRSVIFSLQAETGPAGGLRAEILRVTHDEQAVLGFEARVHFEGVIDTTPDEIAAQLLPTLREALSNVGQHAQASSALVTITTNDTLTLRVQDNGVGISDDHPTGHGIRNAEQRAARLGGSCEITAGATGGTIFEWSVPLQH